MLTQTDPRPALWNARARLVDNLTRQRRELAKTCGCQHCGDSKARTQMIDRIHISMQRLDQLNDQIASRP